MKIDNRNVTDIEKRMKQLASAYVPEWTFNKENPDIGTTIGLIFAEQMEDSIHDFNRILDTYHTEFVNMLDLSLLPAKPSCAVVLLKLIQDTIPGTRVRKGTQLLSNTSPALVFETAYNLYVTSSQLCCAFMTEVETGKILPLLGEFPKAAFYPNEESVSTKTSEEQSEEHHKMKTFHLFSDPREGIEQNALLFYHNAILDVEDNNIYVRITGSQELTTLIAEGKFHFLYVTDEGMSFVEHVDLMEDGVTFLLQKKHQNKKFMLGDKEYSMLILKADCPVVESMEVDDIVFSSAGEAAGADFVNNGSTDFSVDEFDLFGENLSLFNECYIGHFQYFNKPGALIRLAFHVNYLEHTVQFTVKQQQDELKVIKKKPRVLWYDTIADCFAEEIAIEYFNGIGWKRLPCTQDCRGMFSVIKNGTYEISFICPDDWVDTMTGAYKGKAIRFQLLKSDNCYMRPCVHHYPHISDLMITYSYEDKYTRPDYVKAISGTSVLDLSTKAMEGKGYTAFLQSRYSEDALYLGFHRKMEDGPISMFFQLEEGIRYEEIECCFEYSTQNGFKQMKVLDNTGHMSRSGVVLFIPPSDMGRLLIEDKNAYWIRMLPAKKIRKQSKTIFPKILSIHMNAVEAYNIETKQEEDYYLESISPNMQVNLGTDHILDVELWVNERNLYSREEQKTMIISMPDSIRVEYDSFGNITEFYVKWEETDQFHDSGSKRQYILDRLNHQLLFGDGIHTEIPRVLDDVSFKITVRCCNGQDGNLEAGSITESMDKLLFIDEINNPKRAFGGSSIESIGNALQRGANILCSRKRLVSEKDYIREILTFSDNIDKISCVTGYNALGKESKNDIAFIILLKDYDSGSYSFHNLVGNLKAHILKSCELTIAQDSIHIIEPLFVTISVDIWMKIGNLDNSFEIQNRICDCLDDFLSPVSSDGSYGWKIGTLPKKSQIRMRLNSVKQRTSIKKLVITCTYADETGVKEVDMDDICVTPFMICRSGIHRVHFVLAD